MKSFLAFFKKEWLELARTGKLTVLIILFLIFGIMNPAIAKLTPWLMKTLSDSLEGSGITVTNITVDSVTSWTQFHKNIPVALIVFILMLSGVFTSEYQKGTLIQVLTKGASRHGILAAKTSVLMLLWTGCFWLCFGVTFGYNAYFWGNGAAESYIAPALCFWLFGIWIISAAVLFSAASKSGSSVMLGTGGVFIAAYLSGLFPAAENLSPARLIQSAPLLAKQASAADYLPSALTAVLLSAVFLIAASQIFLRRKL